jgi:hypothetical protein
MGRIPELTAYSAAVMIQINSVMHELTLPVYNAVVPSFVLVCVDQKWRGAGYTKLSFVVMILIKVLKVSVCYSRIMLL